MDNVSGLKNRVEQLRAELEAAETQLSNAQATKEGDPIVYLGQLIYANKQRGGSFGYDYGSFGDSEIKRAREVLDTANGDIDIAEAFIVKFNIR